MRWRIDIMNLGCPRARGCVTWRLREGESENRITKRLGCLQIIVCLKGSDSEGEAAATQIWLEFSLKCKYMDTGLNEEMNASFENIIGKPVNMLFQAREWSCCF